MSSPYASYYYGKHKRDDSDDDGAEHPTLRARAMQPTLDNVTRNIGPGVPASVGVSASEFNPGPWSVGAQAAAALAGSMPTIFARGNAMSNQAVVAQIPFKKFAENELNKLDILKTGIVGNSHLFVVKTQTFGDNYRQAAVISFHDLNGVLKDCSDVQATNLINALHYIGVCETPIQKKDSYASYALTAVHGRHECENVWRKDTGLKLDAKVGFKQEKNQLKPVVDDPGMKFTVGTVATFPDTRFGRGTTGGAEIVVAIRRKNP